MISLDHQVRFQSDPAARGGWAAALVAAVGVTLLALDVVAKLDQVSPDGSVGTSTYQIVANAGAMVLPTQPSR